MEILQNTKRPQCGPRTTKGVVVMLSALFSGLASVCASSRSPLHPRRPTLTQPLRNLTTLNQFASLASHNVLPEHQI